MQTQVGDTRLRRLEFFVCFRLTSDASEMELFSYEGEMLSGFELTGSVVLEADAGMQEETFNASQNLFNSNMIKFLKNEVWKKFKAGMTWTNADKKKVEIRF